MITLKNLVRAFNVLKYDTKTQEEFLEKVILNYNARNELLDEKIKIVFFKDFNNCYDLLNYFFSWWDLELNEDDEKQAKATKGEDFYLLVESWKGSFVDTFNDYDYIFLCNEFILGYV